VFYELRQSHRFGFDQLNTKWLELLPEAPPPQWAHEELPTLLALIHPDFRFDRNGTIVQSSDYQRKRFSNHIKYERCQIHLLVEGVKCPYQDSFENSVADHLWPHSLGGPTIPLNKLTLCSQCNTQKSNSPLLFPGRNVPRWLRLQVLALVNKKECLGQII
jgi:hypothetical protein